MYLTFEVVSANAALLGGARRKVFTVDGGRIGRAPENDMVLSGAGVHRHHATVRFINGVFFIEGVGSNGIAVNNPEVVLPRNEPYPIKAGDKVFIDEFEIAVAVSVAPPVESPAARPAPREPAGGARESTGPGLRPAAPILSGSESADDLDPLRMLNAPGAGTGAGAGAGAVPPRAPRIPVESAWNHTPSLSDHFTPPPPTAPAGSMTIPEDWDKTSFNRSKLQPPAPHASPPQPSRPPPLPIPPPPPARAAQPQRPVPPPQPARPAPAHGAGPGAAMGSMGAPGSMGPAGSMGAPGSMGPAGSMGTPGSMGPAGSMGAPGSMSPAGSMGAMGSAGPAGPAFDWDSFLRAAGVDPASVPPDSAAVLGHIMRSVVQGLIEVLRARSEIKTEFRMPVTQVKVSENNPLKFAANAEDALSNLFGRRNAAYLGPQEAFEDAFNDVRFHQLAMLVGVRAGFDSLMSRFDPEQLLELFERQGKRGSLFGGGGKGRYWELYSERFQELAADRDDTFRRLFGEEFARAYEQQLAVLKRGRGGTQR